jgi:hypothetical protein
MTAMLVLRPKQRVHFLVMAGFGPAIHVFAADRSVRCEYVDTRHKAGHDELAGRCIIRMSQNTREVAGFAYRMLYIDPMLVRSALGVCAITPFVPDAVAEDPALAAVLAEAFETFPGALDPLALPAVVAGLSEALWRRCDRKISKPRRSDDNIAVKRARAFLDTAIESSVTERSNGWTRVVKPTVASAPPMPALTTWRGR